MAVFSFLSLYVSQSCDGIATCATSLQSHRPDLPRSFLLSMVKTTTISFKTSHEFRLEFEGEWILPSVIQPTVILTMRQQSFERSGNSSSNKMGVNDIILTIDGPLNCTTG